MNFLHAPEGKGYERFRSHRVYLCLSAGGALLLPVMFLLLSAPVMAQERILELFPVTPLSLDLAIHSIVEPHSDHLISVQTGATMLRYGDAEIRGLYRYLNQHSGEEFFHEHILLLNGRWNNFLDLLDVSEDWRVGRFLKHLLFGPLEDRVVPYLGLLAGPVLPVGHSDVGYWYGGQIGVRFLVSTGIALDMGLEYSRFGEGFRSDDLKAAQFILFTGLDF